MAADIIVASSPADRAAVLSTATVRFATQLHSGQIDPRAGGFNIFVPHLFEATRRAYSPGYIRLGDPAQLTFFDDIYGHDRRLEALLQRASRDLAKL